MSDGMDVLKVLRDVRFSAGECWYGADENGGATTGGTGGTGGGTGGGSGGGTGWLGAMGGQKFRFPNDAVGS